MKSSSPTTTGPTRFAVLCALFVLQAVHGFSNTEQSSSLKSTSTTQLNMAWTLPTPTKLTFQPAWYQECGNPTIRRVVYDDYEDEEEQSYSFAFANYGLEEQSDEQPAAATDEQLPRGARIGRVARRVVQGLRNTLNH